METMSRNEQRDRDRHAFALAMAAPALADLEELMLVTKFLTFRS
jgi:hypothetical protein